MSFSADLKYITLFKSFVLLLHPNQDEKIPYKGSLERSINKERFLLSIFPKDIRNIVWYQVQLSCKISLNLEA